MKCSLPLLSTTMAISIVQYTDAFKNDIGPFVISIQHEHGVPITLEQQPDLYKINEVYMQTGGNFWVATDNGNVVGTIALINMGDGIACLRKMFAAPAYRGAPHRLGQKLLDILLPWAKANGFKQIYLGTVDILKAAQRFYEKNGFSKFPEEQLPASIQRIKMPDDNTYYAMELAA